MDAGLIRCSSAPGDVPSCDGTPAGQLVSFQLTDANKPVLHFQLGSLSGSRAVPTVYFEKSTGRIVHAAVELDAKQLATITPGDLLYLLGSVVGLAPATGVDSVMTLPTPASALTSADEAAICKLYGSTSFCGD